MGSPQLKPSRYYQYEYQYEIHIMNHIMHMISIQYSTRENEVVLYRQDPEESTSPNSAEGKELRIIKIIYL